jgi:hypothetical protein
MSFFFTSIYCYTYYILLAADELLNISQKYQTKMDEKRRRVRKAFNFSLCSYSTGPKSISLDTLS